MPVAVSPNIARAIKNDEYMKLLAKYVEDGPSGIQFYTFEKDKLKDVVDEYSTTTTNSIVKDHKYFTYAILITLTVFVAVTLILGFMYDAYLFSILLTSSYFLVAVVIENIRRKVLNNQFYTVMAMVDHILKDFVMDDVMMRAAEATFQLNQVQKEMERIEKVETANHVTYGKLLERVYNDNRELYREHMADIGSEDPNIYDHARIATKFKN